MTHLSDYSFLQRAITLTYVLLWYLGRVWSIDRFSSLHPRHFKRGELKSIVSWLILIMLPFQLFYDITSCTIKYQEGFINIFGHIMAKPEFRWAKLNQNLVIPTDYSLCVGFSLQTGTLLLLQCFWNYLANTVARAKFMSSKEFKFYIIWTVTALFMFPALQYHFSRDMYDPTYKEIMPQMVYGCGIIIISLLGVRSYFRFQNLLNLSRDVDDGRFITSKIRYFQELNLILSFALFLAGTSMVILCADGLTGKKTLNVHKFSADFLICVANTLSIVAWVILILIIHPKNPRSPKNFNSGSMTGSSNRYSPGRVIAPPVPAVPRLSKYSITKLGHTKGNQSGSYETESLSSYSAAGYTRKPVVPSFQDSNVSSQAEMMAIGVDLNSDHDSTKAAKKPLVGSYCLPSVHLLRPAD